MIPVVVVEFDETLRGTFHDLLTNEGSYTLIEVSEEKAALAYLAAAPRGVVIVVSNRDAHHQLTAAFFAVVAADERLAKQHRYILLSTNPAGIPDELRAHLAQLNVPILAKPFEVEALLVVIRDAATHLLLPAPVPAAVRETPHDT
jgi:CheY-like chemotaxis protein